ncbi:MAG: metallophosphoesterase [Bryobacterales bacterium]|nr:metallophosphoesterase [Bryobacterales bacterium]
MSIARRQFLCYAGFAGPAGFLSIATRARAQSSQVAAVPFKLPLKPNSTRFAVIGDSGTGDTPQFQIAQEMERLHSEFPFEFVLMLGDNIYGNNDPAGFKQKFEDPYQPLLKSGIKFYATLGNHDDPNQRLYKPFNMDGKRFYNFKKGDAHFFALDSNYMSPEQLSWIQKELSGSSAKWKICFFHHPLYSDARFHGPDVDLRKQLEPLLNQYGVNVVLNGHEHVYERLQPHNGVQYFILGSGGQLRRGDLRPSRDTAKGFDTDRAFALMEVAGDELYFQVISARHETVDSGVLTKMKAAAAGQGN